MRLAGLSRPAKEAENAGEKREKRGEVGQKGEGGKEKEADVPEGGRKRESHLSISRILHSKFP